ncbi:pyroglutamyl-peptidase I [Paenibacillus sp. GCM10023250]|uniref:pyroglutamyl-peptidase I n=1 Tax=Paenibacillus sp. GCM10023250 TaxID=3252648 RepID=UPI003617CE02
MQKVLLTGFDPFGGETTNPAWEAVSRLRGKRYDGFEVEVRQVPTVFRTSLLALRQAMLEVRPDVVIGVGQAGGRSDIAVERVAINLDDARIPDNGGEQPLDQPIAEDGPAAYWSTLPVKAIAAGIREAGIPASVSLSAGSFVCNHLFYGLRHLIATEFTACRGGFLHVPYLPEQTIGRAPTPSMSLAHMVSAIEIAAKVSVRYDKDIVAVEGRLD